MSLVPHELRPIEGPCSALIGEGPAYPCNLPGRGVAHYATRQGKTYRCGQLTYCEEHGGETRAREEEASRADRCWNGLAPDSVPMHRVGAAGAMSLSSEHAFVSLRQVDGRWQVGLGKWGRLAHTEQGSYATTVEAERVGIHIWRRRLAERVDLIRSARGGTLDWGIEVRPRELPIVLVAREGEPAPEQGRPPLAEALQGEPRLALSSRDRKAMEWVLTGHCPGKQHRERLEQLLARAEELGVSLPDEARVRAALEGK